MWFDQACLFKLDNYAYSTFTSCTDCTTDFSCKRDINQMKMWCKSKKLLNQLLKQLKNWVVRMSHKQDPWHVKCKMCGAILWLIQFVQLLVTSYAHLPFFLSNTFTLFDINKCRLNFHSFKCFNGWLMDFLYLHHFYLINTLFAHKIFYLCLVWFAQLLNIPSTIIPNFSTVKFVINVNCFSYL